MSKNVFAETDSFRRLLIGAAGGYALQGHHEAAEAVMHVVDALDELTTGGKGESRPSENSTPGSRKWSGFTLTARFCLVSCKPWSW